MNESRKSIDKLLLSLQERAKELTCLYRTEEILSNHNQNIDNICKKIIQAIPPGWQYPDICQAKIILENKIYQSPDFVETEWMQSADIIVQNIVVGSINVYYTQEMPAADKGPFLKEEDKLIHTIAERMGHFILYQRMRRITQEVETARQESSDKGRGEWQVVLQMLRQTDRNLYLNIARKMLNHLCWSGIAEAEQLYQTFGMDQQKFEEEELLNDWNIPNQRQLFSLTDEFGASAFKIATKHLSDDEILGLIQKWVQEDKLSFMVQVVNRNLSLAEVADAIRRYHHLAPEETSQPSPSKIGVLVSLIRRFLSDQLQYIQVAKNFVQIKDFYNLLENLIFSAESHGKLGGKSAGLYLSSRILEEKARDNELLSNVKIPKTWHITSDVLLYFMHYNNFDEVVEQKYKEINQVRREYPHIVQTFKGARFPADIIKGLSVALDDFGDKPLIVRSSSLLEDRMGAAFSGKYKSLFLANRGSKQQRLEALMDAIAEVYASTFSPDPIEYRAERGLLDFGEEMGIMVQEVVGTQVGKFYLPTFAGVAFSNNEFRWSPRIKRKDGLVRLVPGLGTRAVDRLSDDYPVLFAPGQPGLRVNVTPDEIIRYSPKKIDVINLDTNSFETIDIKAFLKEVGYDLPGLKDLVSVFEYGRISKSVGMNVDFDKDDLIVTFDGLASKTKFVKQMDTILNTLEQTLGIPVDIEFASDGHDFYLLQCRPQSYSAQSRPAPIPKDIPREKIVFSANKYISNGCVDNITHIVYVESDKYSQMEKRSDLVDIGRAVGKLNKLLPKRQFVLMGPGRWGSRGDIKLGINVTYSDISNSAILIEIARKKGNYLPDLSFGTHFFQDLVESNIKYLPLYPDDDGIQFNERFLKGAKNILSEIIPEYAHLAETIHLIDVPQATRGRVLKVLMNADLEEAVGILEEPGEAEADTTTLVSEPDRVQQESFWRWRLRMAERIAADLDPKRFGVVNFYVFGSTKNATAGPGSDIDIIIHFTGDENQKKELDNWLEGWSRALAEMNYIRTGYASEGLLDIHYVTDEDIEKKTSYAAKINAVTDPARQLKMKDAAN